MRVLITGCCGFVGSSLSEMLSRSTAGSDRSLELIGIDNLCRRGSEINRKKVASLGLRFVHGDIRLPSDVDALGRVDWVIDAAANPNVLAGTDGKASTRQIVEHNLVSTLNILEFCKRHGAGLILLSTSRTYSIERLRSLKLAKLPNSFALDTEVSQVGAVTPAGVPEGFPTDPPLSFYGSTKHASETLALEYGAAFGFPVWINRCGLLAGAGQFGHPSQGVVAYWIHSWFERCPLRYIGFNGRGLQVRDCLHPRDLAELVMTQMTTTTGTGHTVFNVAGGADRAFSLLQLSEWCQQRFGSHAVASSDDSRAFDVPWLILDSSRAETVWNWKPRVSREEIFGEIAEHAASHPNWMELSAGP